jgi:pyruvate/2-oxoglutarate dehydrogenase complex dihydrolipoamide acyltransferase (E2) component
MTKRGMSLLAIVALLAAGLSSACTAEASRSEKPKGDQSGDSAHSVVVKDAIWYPWRFEPMVWEDNARVDYRHHEEKAAVDELGKAESWLRFAASNALPETRKALEAAASDLHSLAGDLEQGKVVKADRLDYAVARADEALAQWHYFKAKEGAARSEEADAAMHLRTAASYLEHAAASARYPYGPKTTRFFEDIDEYGRVIDEGATIEPGPLASHLAALEQEIHRMATTLDEAARPHAAG